MSLYRQQHYPNLPFDTIHFYFTSLTQNGRHAPLTVHCKIFQIIDSWLEKRSISALNMQRFLKICCFPNTHAQHKTKTREKIIILWMRSRAGCYLNLAAKEKWKKMRNFIEKNVYFQRPCSEWGSRKRKWYFLSLVTCSKWGWLIF